MTHLLIDLGIVYVAGFFLAGTLMSAAGDIDGIYDRPGWEPSMPAIVVMSLGRALVWPVIVVLYLRSGWREVKAGQREDESTPVP